LPRRIVSASLDIRMVGPREERVRGERSSMVGRGLREIGEPSRETDGKRGGARPFEVRLVNSEAMGIRYKAYHNLGSKYRMSIINSFDRSVSGVK